MTAQQTKGGPMARAAGILCRDADFQLYLDRRRRHKHGISEQDLPDGTHNDQDARDWLCQVCGISSRAELDHNFEAAAMFRKVRNSYNRWRARSKDERQHADTQQHDQRGTA